MENDQKEGAGKKDQKIRTAELRQKLFKSVVHSFSMFRVN